MGLQRVAKGSCSTEAQCSFKHDNQKRGKHVNATRDDEADQLSLSPRLHPSLGAELSARTRRSSSGKDDQPYCFNHKRGQCLKDHNCEDWRPPVCIFQKKNQCSAGYQCPFVHLSKDDRRVPEGKEKETTSKTPTRSVNRRKLGETPCMIQKFMPRCGRSS